jgi:hypothetical protein
MDGYQFIASLFSSLVALAWPAALVVCVWLFRERLTTLLPLLRMKYKDLDVSFRLDQAEKEAALLPFAPQEGAEMQATPEERDKFNRLVEISPRAAVLELRSELEEALRSVAQAHGIPKAGAQGAMALTRILRNTGAIDEKTSALLDDLRAIGNSAAHASQDFSMEKSDALRFRKLVDQAIRRLRFHELNDDPDR